LFYDRPSIKRLVGGLQLALIDRRATNILSHAMLLSSTRERFRMPGISHARIERRFPRAGPRSIREFRELGNSILMLNGLQVAPDSEHKDNCALSETIRFSGRRTLLGNAIFEDARASHAPPDFRVIIIREETAPCILPC